MYVQETARGLEAFLLQDTNAIIRKEPHRILRPLLLVCFNRVPKLLQVLGLVAVTSFILKFCSSYHHTLHISTIK